MAAVKPHPSLIGISGWDPFGESMLSIVRKIEIANQLKSIEIGRLFGSDGSNTFKLMGTSDPDNEDALDFAKLFSLTGWTIDDLRASYSGFYRIVTNKPYTLFFGNRLEVDKFVHRDIRICQECSKEGIHLLCHQLPYWHKCPIHFSQLLKICPYCNNRYGLYSFRKQDQTGQGLVSSCQYCSEKGDVATIQALASSTKRDVLTEYGEWIENLTSCRMNKDKSRALFGGINAQRDIFKLHALIPGPRWIEQCIHAPAEITTGTIGKYKEEYNCANNDDIEREGIWDVRYKRRLEPRCQNIVDIVADAMDSCKIVATEIDRLKITDEWNEIGICELRQSSISFSIRETTKASSAAAFAWDRICDRSIVGDSAAEIYKINARWYLMFPWVQHWLNGPGMLAWSTKQNQDWENKALIQAITKDWWKHLFENLFYYLYLRCLLLPSCAAFHPWEREDYFGVEASTNGSLPIYLIDQNNERTTLKYATTMLPKHILNNYIKLDQAGSPISVSDTKLTKILIMDEFYRNTDIREQTACFSDLLSKMASVETQ